MYHLFQTLYPISTKKAFENNDFYFIVVLEGGSLSPIEERKVSSLHICPVGAIWTVEARTVFGQLTSSMNRLFQTDNSIYRFSAIHVYQREHQPFVRYKPLGRSSYKRRSTFTAEYCICSTNLFDYIDTHIRS